MRLCLQLTCKIGRMYKAKLSIREKRMDEQLHQRVEKSYMEINDKWMRFHIHLLFICTAIGALMETLMFFIIVETNTLTCTISEYWIKYILIPVSISVCISLLGCFVIKSNNISTMYKQYIISFIFSLFAFVISLAHSGFIAVLSCAIIPVLLTIMYENRILTTAVTVACMLFQFLSANITFWDSAKELNHSYFINMIILMSATFCVWLTSCYMISFINMKKKITIGNDIERHLLQEQINIDGLTLVGNKMALMKMLEEVTTDNISINYLAMIDIDDFKKINDSYGHIFGDEVLRCVGEGMRQFGVDAHSFRYGGDEFCALFEEPSLEVVLEAIKVFQEYVKNSLKVKNNDADIYISVGITRFTVAKTTEEILEQADSALYKSKRHYGGQITVF